MITDQVLRAAAVRPLAQLYTASNAHDLHMQDTRTNEWLSRLQSNGPHLVSLVLAALIAVELARIAMSLLGGPVKSPQPVIAGTAPSPPRPAANVQAVVSAHLFGVAAADPSTQDPANAPLSSANLVLAGTIATQDPKRGIAIISDGGPSKVYSVGDNVNGASLHSVYLDHVILDRGGTLETLLLPRQFAGVAAAPRCRAPDRRRPAHGGGRRQHPPHGAAGSRDAGSGHAHRALLRQRRRQTARLSRLPGPEPRHFQQTGFEAWRLGHGNQRPSPR